MASDPGAGYRQNDRRAGPNHRSSISYRIPSHRHHWETVDNNGMASRTNSNSIAKHIRRAAVLLLFAAAAIALAWYWLAPPMVKVGHPTRGPAIQAVYATGNVE